MSVLFTYDKCYLIDHNDYISNLYKNVSENDELSRNYFHTFKLVCKLFCIKNNTNKNRKRKLIDECSETLHVKQTFDSFKQKIPLTIREKVMDQLNITETKDVRLLAQRLFEGNTFKQIVMNGGNLLDRPLKCEINGDSYLIPPKSRFYCGCVKEQCEKLSGKRFDILVVDPPWWNKYIRRLKSSNDKLSYSMMYNEEIASIPVKNILAPDCLVAVWCTNSPSCIEAVKNSIFPNWGLEYIATWYWLKVSIDFEPLCEFSSGCQKQPYERIILGKVGNVTNVPQDNLVISVPSALHSHKPPIIDLLKPYINVEEPEILELFARYLLPNTTSVGYEPLKWQHLSLYESVPNKSDVTYKVFITY